MTNKQERGAIMLEVLAVLALIGVMGPMLYRQVLSRNQEISNVNIAAEMRAIKEAMSSAIAADSAVLAELCKADATSSDLEPCGAGEATFKAAVEDFLPIGMEHILEPGYGYDIKLYTYVVSLSNGEEYPIAVGVVVGSDLAENWSFKRAARIANLIGTDGGVKQGINLVGSGGSWQLDGIATDYDDNVVVATTAMDTFDPDLGATDPNAVAVPGSLAFANLHAWSYFSVGDKGPTATGRCFELSRNLDDKGAGSGDATTPDGIYHVGEGDNCDPLFWVGAKGTDGDKSTAGQVYVKNNLYVGRDNSENKQAFAFEVKGTKDHDNKDVTNSRIVVYNIDGDDTLEINANGQIISRNQTLKVKDKQTTISNDDGTVNIKNEEGELNYGLDPANTSVLNDVRLASRGGARLSDILPNYISKGIFQLTSSDTKNPYTWQQTKPTCPPDYVAAITVTPLKWGASSVQEIKIPTGTEVDVSGLSAPAGGGSLTGTATVKEKTISSENITQYSLAIEVNGSGDDERIDDSKSEWTVSMGYKKDDGNWVSDLSLKTGEIQALAQTYCVYTGTINKPDDKL